jgi:hypothetical protein
MHASSASIPLLPCVPTCSTMRAHLLLEHRARVLSCANSDSWLHAHLHDSSAILHQGLKNRSIFLEIASAGSVGFDFKNHQSFELKFRNFEKIKKSGKLCKKLDKILRILMEKFFQISTVLLDKIQIE